MSGKLAWGYDTTNKVWLPIVVDSSGRLKVDMSNIDLGDLGNVDLTGLADDDFLYYDLASGLWKPRKLADADIPATIARDSEVTAAVAAEAAARIADVDAEAADRAAADAAHAALDTEVHGAGEETLLNTGTGYRIVDSAVTYTIGAAGNYATLAAACADLRGLILQDDITLKLAEDVTETAQIDIRGIVSMGGILRIELNGHTSTWTQNADPMMIIRGSVSACIQTEDGEGGKILIDHPSPSGVDVIYMLDYAWLRWSRNDATEIDIDNQAIDRVFRIADGSALYWRAGSATNTGNVATAVTFGLNAARIVGQANPPTPWGFAQGAMLIDSDGHIHTKAGEFIP